MTDREQKVFEFGEFLLESRTRRLLRRGQPVALAPKAFDVLLALIEADGQVVSKTQLLERVWPGVFVEEANLPQNISLVRKALDEAPQDHRYVVTLPGVGYRFAAAVSTRGGGGSRPAPSVAVLPFQNETGDAAVDYLCDGLAEGVITTLSRLREVRVKARAVVFRLRGRDLDPVTAGRELGVGLVVVGRLTPAALVVELIDVSTGWQVWTGDFSAQARESMAVQEALVRQIASTLQVTLSDDEQSRVATRATRSSPAYQSYMKGRYLLNKRLTETLPPAVTCFREAIDLDPQFALAYVGLADTYALQSLYGALTPSAAYPPSRAAALKALELDDTLAEAHTALGVYELFFGWDWNAAERAFHRALALNAEAADAHQRFGMYLTARGRFDEAREALARARALDPLSLITSTIAAYPDYYQRRYDDAERQLALVLQLDPQFSMAHFRRGLALTQLGRFEEAEAALLVSKQLSNDRDVVAALGRLWALQGRTVEAREAIAQLHERSKATFVPSYALAVVEAALGDVTAAFHWLAQALAERSYWLIYLEVDPALDPLRGDPRFADIATGMKQRPQG